MSLPSRVGRTPGTWNSRQSVGICVQDLLSGGHPCTPECEAELLSRFAELEEADHWEAVVQSSLQNLGVYPRNKQLEEFVNKVTFNLKVHPEEWFLREKRPPFVGPPDPAVVEAARKRAKDQAEIRGKVLEKIWANRIDNCPDCKGPLVLHDEDGEDWLLEEHHICLGNSNCRVAVVAVSARGVSVVRRGAQAQAEYEERVRLWGDVF